MNRRNFISPLVAALSATFVAGAGWLGARAQFIAPPPPPGFGLCMVDPKTGKLQKYCSCERNRDCLSNRCRKNVCRGAWQDFD